MRYISAMSKAQTRVSVPHSHLNPQNNVAQTLLSVLVHAAEMPARGRTR